jgi:hypothetical protein
MGGTLYGAAVGRRRGIGPISGARGPSTVEQRRIAILILPMSLIALLDPDGPADGVAGLWLELIGQLHPALVHFPVALLVVAAALELVNTIGGVLGREDGEYPSSAARTCLTLAALGAW